RPTRQPRSSVKRPTAAGNRPFDDRPAIAGNRPSVGSPPSIANTPSIGKTPGKVGGSVAGSRPSTRDVKDFLDVPDSARPGTRPGFGAGAATGIAGSAVGEFLQDRGGASQLPARDRPRAGDGQLANNRPDRIENRQ